MLHSTFYEWSENLNEINVEVTINLPINYSQAWNKQTRHMFPLCGENTNLSMDAA